MKLNRWGIFGITKYNIDSSRDDVHSVIRELQYSLCGYNSDQAPCCDNAWSFQEAGGNRCGRGVDLAPPRPTQSAQPSDQV